jgi:hypothetical protein
MANKEPQSYGSQGDWVTGDVGEQVNRQKGKPSSQQADFYESRHDHDEQPSTVSPVQAAENEAPPSSDARGGDETPVQKVATAESGAKRDGYFKKRDYE